MSNSAEDREMADEYDFTNAPRGTKFRQYRERSDAVFLSPDVASVFPDSIAVNEALRTLMRIRGDKTLADAGN